MSGAHFSDDPETVWDTEPKNRTMTLLKDFWFIDPSKEEWRAPKDSGVDGASIPKFLWSTVGSPYTGAYRRASIVHDIACKAAGKDYAKRLAADKMFFHACLTGGCSTWEAIVLYIGVRFGAWMSRAGLKDDDRIQIERDLVQRRLEEDFKSTCELVLRQGESDDVEVVSDRVELAMKRVLAARVAYANAARAFTAIE